MPTSSHVQIACEPLNSGPCDSNEGRCLTASMTTVPLHGRGADGPAPTAHLWLLKGTVTDKAVWRRTTRSAIALSVALTIGLVSAVTFVCVAGEALLPRVVLDSRHLSPLWPYAGAPVALLSLAALVVLWTRGRSVLNLWLTVVMCLYTIEIPLSYYRTPFRFSIGWYAVRVIGFVSSTLVLTVLLYEIQAIYAKLLEAVLAQRREREARLMTGDAVAATIAHEVRQPLTAMIASAEAGLRFSTARCLVSTKQRKRSHGLSLTDIGRATWWEAFGRFLETIPELEPRSTSTSLSATYLPWNGGICINTRYSSSSSQAHSSWRSAEIEFNCSRCFST